MNYEVLESSDKNVYKYVFTGKDFVAESVLYKYGGFYERTVICCSVQSGCSVGCAFCGTGKNFIRNLDWREIVKQVSIVLKDKAIEDVDRNGKRFQIMFMSMGEPMLNWGNVEKAIVYLHDMFPNAELLISTVGIDNDKVFNDIIRLSKQIHKIGLQFSIHKAFDNERDILIPYKNKMDLMKIRGVGFRWWKETGRKPYLNYCIDGTNNTTQDSDELMLLFDYMVFNFTFSVVCSNDETMRHAGFRNINEIKKFEQRFIDEGYNTRVFDPAGQDDIGGGCGMLWYVQKWLKENRGE